MKGNIGFKFKPVAVLFLAIGFLFSPFFVEARDNVTDWYIQDFDTEIRVENDSTLDIIERITADCGQATGKHGIFRILPERINIQGGETIKTPVELIAITDYDGNQLKYSESRNFSDKTVTWKIGDAKKTVQGVNYYKLHYRVKNVNRFDNPEFDEFYWNLNGNFWDLETDKFHAAIIFPSTVNQSNTQVEYYTGYLGEKRKDLATYYWSAPNVLDFSSQQTLLPKEGITTSVVFPKGIFVPYKFSFFELYGDYIWYLLPLMTFFAAFYVWWKYGRDPIVDKAIMPEYDAPAKLTPLELGMVMNNGSFSNTLITAEIINLATKKIITIKEIENKILFFHTKDYSLTRNLNLPDERDLTEPQKAILKKLFSGGQTVLLSALKNKFYQAVPIIKEKSEKIMMEKGFFVPSGHSWQAAFVIGGIVWMVVAFFWMNISWHLTIALLVSGLCIFLFGLIMPKRTMLGANLNWEIKGFKMFMETVDKDRAQFYEEENIFEKFLPYAIVFGITKLWIKKMKEIYGEDYFAKHAPAWYIGGSAMAFNADTFNSAMDSLSSGIAASTSSPSGSGGSGGSGGGGGGGGGGGW